MSKGHRNIRLFGCALLVGCFLALAGVAAAHATATTNRAVAEISLVSAPLGFKYGQTLHYRLKVRNLTASRLPLYLFYALGDRVAPQKGGPWSQKAIVLQAHGKRIIKLDTPAPVPPQQYEAACLTVLLHETNPFEGGVFTCARLIK